MANIVPLGFVALLFLISFFKFDQLVSLEYRLHRSDWIADGMPHGIFWLPTEATMLGGWLIRGRSSLATHRCWIKWLFSSPNCARQDKNLRRILFQWRLLVIVSNLTFLALLGFALWR